jgi:hypothetical protein
MILLKEGSGDGNEKGAILSPVGSLGNTDMYC